MASNQPTPLPPTTLHHITPIPQTTAHALLTTYLEHAAADPSLQPNSAISEHGPVSRSTAAAPNLILHNLRRVLAGLGGDVLGRNLSLDAEGLDGDENGDGEQGQGRKQGQGERQVQEQGQGEQMEVDAEEQGGIDKEERKRKKKERRQAEKKSKVKTESDEEA